MPIQNRRQFFKNASPLIALPWLRTKGIFTSSPDTILYNANVITVNPKNPEAQAIAILGEKVVAIGENDQILKLANSNTKKINIAGKTVVPGFIDAHSHPASSGLSHLRNVDIDLRSIEEIKKAIQERAKKTPPGEWILGFKYDDTKIKEGRLINRYDLDEAAPNHPVRIKHRGGHSTYVNSTALNLMGYDRSTPDPKGGKIGRDGKTGELTGQLLETAGYPLSKLIPNTFTEKDHQEGVRLITKMMTKSGVTSVTEAYGSSTFLKAYQDAYSADELSMRIYSMISYREIDKFIDAGIKTGFGDEWLRIGGMKITIDGSISERTARLSKPYIGRPNDYGILVMEQEEVYKYAHKAHTNGWQIGVHANGDVGIDKTLNIYERLQKEHPRIDPRFRLEHCTVINDDLVRRIKKLNAIPNPFSTYVYFHGEKMKQYGKERLENMFAVRSFLDAGIKVTQTSDYPPGPFEPMMAIQSSVTRTDINGNIWGPSQKISVEEAIKVGTIHGAYASYEESIKGSLEIGKLADLVVLGKDLRKVDPMEIIDIPIERTMVGGKWKYES
jgi:predicted amidohydrolase YtcJ